MAGGVSIILSEFCISATHSWTEKIIPDSLLPSSALVHYAETRFHLGSPNQIAKITNTIPIKIATIFQSLLFLFLIQENPKAIKNIPIIADKTITINPIFTCSVPNELSFHGD